MLFFTGLFNIPVKCLIEPHASRLVHDPNLKYVKALKDEMLNNPTSNVAPLIQAVIITDSVESYQTVYITEGTSGWTNSRAYY